MNSKLGVEFDRVRVVWRICALLQPVHLCDLGLCYWPDIALGNSMLVHPQSVAGVDC